MTRETKIGLLVGLAFIIVIGILLSDHLSSTNESPVASLPLAANTLRAGLGEPVGDQGGAFHQPTAVIPRQSVPTREELNRREKIRRADEQGVTLVNPGNMNFNPPPAVPQQSQTQVQIPDAQARGDSVTDRLRQAALAQGEQIEPVGENNADGGNRTNPNIPSSRQQDSPVQLQPRAVATEYKAQSGDTLGAIALNTLGANNRANREAIVAANPGLQSNRNLIIAGRSYSIPALVGGRAIASSPVTPVANETQTDAEPANDPGSVYVVQAGDSLWSIAVNELGSSSAVGAIKELNQEVLDGSDRVRPNMKLRLPAKKVASAN